MIKWNVRIIEKGFLKYSRNELDVQITFRNNNALRTYMEERYVFISRLRIGHTALVFIKQGSMDRESVTHVES